MIVAHLVIIERGLGKIKVKDKRRDRSKLIMRKEFQCVDKLRDIRNIKVTT